jgi:hypothetical protein
MPDLEQHRLLHPTQQPFTDNLIVFIRHSGEVREW